MLLLHDDTKVPERCLSVSIWSIWTLLHSGRSRLSSLSNPGGLIRKIQSGPALSFDND